MNYDSLLESLVDVLPEVLPEMKASQELWEEDFGPSVMYEFLPETLERLVHEGNLDAVKRGMEFIEELIRSPDEKTRTVVAPMVIDGLGESFLADLQSKGLAKEHTLQYATRRDSFWKWATYGDLEEQDL